MKSICQNSKWFIGQFKMPKGSANRLLWVVLSTSETSEVRAFCGLANSTHLIHERSRFQWTNG